MKQGVRSCYKSQSLIRSAHVVVQLRDSSHYWDHDTKNVQSMYEVGDKMTYEKRRAYGPAEPAFHLIPSLL